MNIFVLSENPVECAQMMCDKHVVKMVLETAQLLSAAHIILDGKAAYDNKKLKYTHPNESLYKLTHSNHPCSIWARETSANYQWLYEHFVALCDEYTFRYGKIHLTDTKLRHVLSITPSNIKTGFKSIQPKCMPIE